MMKKNATYMLGILFVSVGLSTVGLFLGHPINMLIFLFVGVVVGANTWVQSNFSKKGVGDALVVFLMITFGLGGLYGGYVLLSPAHRESVRNEPATHATQEALESASVMAASRLAEKAGLIETEMRGQPKGTLLVVLKLNGGTVLADVVRSPSYSFGAGFNHVTIPEGLDFTQDFREAGTVLWIEENARIVGSYHQKILGPITALKTGDALRYTWKAWLIDISKGQVLAQKTFVGADPPQTTEGSGDFGIPPQTALADWLLELMKNQE